MKKRSFIVAVILVHMISTLVVVLEQAEKSRNFLDGVPFMKHKPKGICFNTYLPQKEIDITISMGLCFTHPALGAAQRVISRDGSVAMVELP